MSDPARARPGVTLVAAVGRNGVIGTAGQLPWQLPEDLAHFKALTVGGTLVMGRRTWDSIGRALPGRTTVVVTRQPGWSAPGAVVAHSLVEALAAAEASDPDSTGVFVVGGGELYRAALDADVVDRLVLSEVDLAPRGDTFFPAVSRKRFAEVGRQHRQGFDVVTYDRAG